MDVKRTRKEKGAYGEKGTGLKFFKCWGMGKECESGETLRKISNFEAH